LADRLFTLDEAQEMVPWLAETFEAIGPLQARVRELSGEIDAITRRAKSNGGGGAETELASRRRELQKNSEQVEKRLQEIRDRGLVVRSLDDGLVDFPTQREGRYVYLCWREGEAEIRFWHDLDTGFAGRQPL
jgi:hypothetical protein